MQSCNNIKLFGFLSAECAIMYPSPSGKLAAAVGSCVAVAVYETKDVDTGYPLVLLITERSAQNI